jgi:serine/threonine-protein phosphatase PP1 catalytic subunit
MTSEQMDYAVIEGLRLYLWQHRYDIGTQNRLDLDITELGILCQTSKTVLLEDPTFLRLSGPLHIIGDLHGNFGDLVRFLEVFGFPSNRCPECYLFLGDYVDRGDNSIETIAMLLCLKVLYPTQVFLLRGNHECKEMTAIYGFRDNCVELYDEGLWHQFLHVFECLPLAAVVGNSIFYVSPLS